MGETAEIVRHALMARVRASKPGDKLPSERQLGRAIHVGRTAVRLAYDQLVREGHVVVIHGSGHYVAPRPGRHEQ